jgi:hypothetical protein
LLDMFGEIPHSPPQNPLWNPIKSTASVPIASRTTQWRALVFVSGDTWRLTGRSMISSLPNDGWIYKLDLLMCHCCCISCQHYSLYNYTLYSLSNVKNWLTMIDIYVTLLLCIHLMGICHGLEAMTQKIPSILQACCVCFHM